MSSRKNEYSVVVQKDTYGDKCHVVLRESMLPAGLLKVEELARMDYGDMKKPEFPDGLVQPTSEEVMRFGGAKLESSKLSSLELSDYGPAINIDEIKQKITSFVLEAIENGRQPIFAWNDLATTEEVEAFHEAAVKVQIDQNSTGAPTPEQTESYGLYL